MERDQAGLDADPEVRERIGRAVALAARWQDRARALQAPAERRQQAELDRMCRTPEDKATLVQLTDQAFRSRRAGRIAAQFTHVLDVQGIPRFFHPWEQLLLRGFRTFGAWLPGVTVPMVKEHLRHETANVVLPAEPEHLRPHLTARQAEGVRMNLNFLGEVVLGDDEARRRLDRYLGALQWPEVEVLSVKISTLDARISPLAREATVRRLCDRLELLFREAAHLRFRRTDGSEVPKFVYLDMEEYRDLGLTAEAFRRTLDRPGLETASAGIALQAYLPDSLPVLREVRDWAGGRVAAGGAPVTIRLVKGANLEMERVEAAVRGWPQAPYATKRETDANYKRMLHEALEPGKGDGLRLGVASHNLFDLAYALLLAGDRDALPRVQFEMLEGMANHQRRALLEETSRFLLYAPACRKEEFLHAIGYLIRRLDENTGEENFLRHAFRLEVGSADWRILEDGFREAFTLRPSEEPRRTQDRGREPLGEPRPEMSLEAFRNEPDTDWSLPVNGRWAERLVADPVPEGGWGTIPLQVGGEEIGPEARDRRPCLDPSRPGIVLAWRAEGTEDDVDRAVACAREDAGGWERLGVDGRSAVLGRVAAELRAARGVLLRSALACGGKTLAEGDPEVSEAVDFVEFYRASARFWHGLETVRAAPRGVVAVVTPWNFPVAIPCGGIAAALAAGNRVILKPASDTVPVAWELCRCFWRGGVPPEALQFLPGPGRSVGNRLATHPGVDAVILTGGTETAGKLVAARPDLRLFAETGGKNAMIVTALSDRELAIRHVVQSAFGHAGQKCSAVSLLLLEREVYEDEGFRRALVDAVETLVVGSAWELATQMGPLIRPPSGELEEALKTLEPGESWAVLPRPAEGNPNLWTPGVKWGVTPGSVTHRTEFFGPVLGVMPFDGLEEAIGRVNETGYGLTSGLHSLDDREIASWREGIQAGNLYVNRTTTGAVVGRQPFGGMGKSGFGPGMKAGGPNYLASLLRFEEGEAGARPARGGIRTRIRDEGVAELLGRGGLATLAGETGAAWLRGAAESFQRAWDEEFCRIHDTFRILGQDNFRRYLPFPWVGIRVHPRDSAVEILARVVAARITGARVVVSASAPTDVVAWLEAATADWGAAAEFVTESDAALARRLEAGDRWRFADRDRVPMRVRREAAERFATVVDEPVLGEGRLELLWYLREQSVSHDYHRYGNLGAATGRLTPETAR
jgi:RHH-type proline utilization regulon transcriptional repressor/proline dehydrogenase/delta 1-pyrroline-5-carboxylate dehydrogenase